MKAETRHDLQPFSDSAGEDEDPSALARRAVETFIRERLLIAPHLPSSDSILNLKSACFVCIKTPHDLRGCIGTIEPFKNTLAEEIILNAVHAATRDPRFEPITAEELPALLYSVDVLEPPEPAHLEDLDPKEYGVIVEDESGARRGLLLPNIEGIESVDQQVRIAARKAGIELCTPLRLQRFRVHRFREHTPDFNS